ncbi:MAG: Holliday junction resolvase RuvX [Planctomycetota bacterium]|nr:MAG: Holliday junction resolvase RuvX [Planctomycetota bacterium]
MRYLAIDYGDKRTGLAICDHAETIASPLAVIEGQKELIKKINEIVTSENVEAIVLGLPLNMDNSHGPRAKIIFQFAEKLKANLQIPIHFQDERLTSFAAKESLAPAELTREKKKKRLDAIAAAQILQIFLNSKKD